MVDPLVSGFNGGGGVTVFVDGSGACCDGRDDVDWECLPDPPGSAGPMEVLSLAPPLGRPSQVSRSFLQAVDGCAVK